MKVGDLVRLTWVGNQCERPTGEEWDETWIVIEDRTMIIATNPNNPYLAGQVIVWDNGELVNMLASDLEVISEGG